MNPALVAVGRSISTAAGNKMKVENRSQMLQKAQKKAYNLLYLLKNITKKEKIFGFFR